VAGHRRPARLSDWYVPGNRVGAYRLVRRGLRPGKRAASRHWSRGVFPRPVTRRARVDRMAARPGSPSAGRVRVFAGADPFPRMPRVGGPTFSSRCGGRLAAPAPRWPPGGYCPGVPADRRGDQAARDYLALAVEVLLACPSPFGHTPGQAASRPAPRRPSRLIPRAPISAARTCRATGLGLPLPRPDTGTPSAGGHPAARRARRPSAMSRISALAWALKSSWLLRRHRLLRAM